MTCKHILTLLTFAACSLSATVTVTSTRDYRIANTRVGADGEATGGSTVTSTNFRQGGGASTTSGTNPSSTGQTTAITSCHFHSTIQFCVDGNGNEGSIVPAPTNTKDAPSQYTGCHAHDEDTFCLDSEGEEVQFMKESETESSSSSTAKGGKNCHFHAGVEHCLAEGESENGSKSADSCERVDRDYNIPLRIGLLFVILVTSAIGAFGPLFVSKIFNFSLEGIVITIIKQFGTGVIISTAFVHLMTHADLMWGNSCISVMYESTATSITMAGIFITFLIEYIGNRVVRSRIEKRQTIISEANNLDSEAHQQERKVVDSSEENITSISSKPHGHDHFQGISPNDKFSVMLMEAGIIFHSILIGITLVVAGDSFFITLFIVILFHQMFEGLALGARIVALNSASLTTKLLMAAAYSLITPIGMAIGIGTLKKFNGNDPSTIIALGTLDSFSAGVLIWTGLIEMWAHDWLFGYLAHSSKLKTAVAFVSLIAGMILMSVLGKWA